MLVVTLDSRNLSGPEQEHITLSITHSSELPSDGSTRGGALEAISGEVLRRRSLEVSPTSFITIISIILGVALGLLAQNTFPAPSPLIAVQSACLLLLFACTFYYYLSMSIVLRWAPSFVDCSAPFLIASLEIPPAYFLGHVAAWNGWLSALFLSVAAGVYSTIKYSPISHFGGDRHPQEMWHRLQRELTYSLIIGALFLGALGVLAQFAPAGEMWWGFTGCVAELATLAMIVARMELRMSQIHAYYGVDRPPFN